MKALAIIDGFRDVDYIQTLYELVPELKPKKEVNWIVKNSLSWIA